METREDGYTYFTHYGYEDDDPRLHTEYKFKKNEDGTYEAYDRDVTNTPFEDNPYRKLQLYKQDGTTTFHFTNLMKFYKEVEDSIVGRGSLRRNKVGMKHKTGKDNLTIRFSNELKEILYDNNIQYSSFIDEAVSEKLRSLGLL